MNWPKVGSEQLDWRDSWRTYDAAIVPAIAGLRITEWLDVETAAKVGAAQQAITAFDEEMTAQFGSLELGTIDTVLLRSEASSSSQIEQLTASAKQLALAEIDASKSVNARLVRANVAAMETAMGVTTFSTERAVEMQRALLGDTGLHVGVRQEQVWIGTSGASPIGAAFVPPHHGRVEANLADLWRFLGEESPLPLAHVAVAHAQFETIHPFVDGNGRVGRALIHAYLRQRGVTDHVTVPLSAGLLADTRGYVHALTEYREGDPRRIVEEFARAALHAAAMGRELLSDLRQIREGWDARIQARRDSVAWRIADQLIGQPALTAALAASRNSVSEPAARAAINALVEAGVLTKVSVGRRNQVWVAEEVTSSFDRLAVLIGRRQVW